MATFEIRSEVQSFIKSVSQAKGIHDYTITDIRTNQKGEGYLGEIFMVTIKDNGSNRLLDIIIKAAFVDEKIRENVPIRQSFQNEVYFYQHVYPTYRKLEREHNVVYSTELAPKCLGVCIEENEEMLALENLKSVGFEVFSKKSTLDHDHVELIFKTYGHLHAYSFALRDQNLEDYLKIKENLHNVYGEFMKQGAFGDYFVEMCKSAYSLLIEGEDDKVIKQFEKYMGRNVINIFENIILEELGDYSAILHGDCWSNNMLFRYEETEEGRKPVDIRLIDWQLLKTGSPVCDLSYCLYSGASKEVYDNINEYLKIYHDSFSLFLRKFGGDPEKLFPYNTLKEHWKKYSKFGMIMALGIIRMKLTVDEELVDFRDGYEMDELMSAATSAKYNEAEYQLRIRNLLWHMYKIGAL